MRERRLSLGLTQPEAAAQIGVCREALAYWEIERTVPALRVMPAVITFLGYNPTPPAQSFPDRLRWVRQRHGFDQRALALALGVRFGSLRMWERGACPPKPARRALIEQRLADLGGDENAAGSGKSGGEHHAG